MRHRGHPGLHAYHGRQCLPQLGTYVEGEKGWQASLVGDEDLEATDNLSERDGSVLLPVLHRLRVVHEDDKILFHALVVYLGLDCVSASHIAGVLVL